MTDSTVHLAEVPASGDAKITVERRGQVVLIGINRPDLDNRLDPDAFQALASAYYAYDNDPSLRCAVLFGHGKCFSQGMDVAAFGKASASSSAPPFALRNDKQLDPLGKKPHLGKPLVVVVHGATWNLGHELHLVADVRIASADTDFTASKP